MTRTGGLILAGAAAALLLGCGGAKKVAVKINQDIVTEDEFYGRVQDMDVVSLETAAREGNLQKAGEVAMQAIISEHLWLQVGAARGIKPTEQEIKAFVAFAKKYPQYSSLPRDPIRTDAEYEREARLQIVVRRLAAQPLKLGPQDYQKTYELYKAQLREPDQHKLHVIATGSEAKAQEALQVLKKGVPFETVAIKYSEDPNVQRNSGDVGWVPDTVLPQSLLDAVRALKPGQVTPAPVAARVPPAGVPPNSPGVRMATRYYVVRLDEFKSGQPPSLEDVRPFIEFMTIASKDRNALSRVQQLVRDELAKATIQVNLDRYKPLVARIKGSLSGQPASGAPANGQP